MSPAAQRRFVSPHPHRDEELAGVGLGRCPLPRRPVPLASRLRSGNARACRLSEGESASGLPTLMGLSTMNARLRGPGQRNCPSSGVWNSLGSTKRGARMEKRSAIVVRGLSALAATLLILVASAASQGGGGHEPKPKSVECGGSDGGTLSGTATGVDSTGDCGALRNDLAAEAIEDQVQCSWCDLFEQCQMSGSVTYGQGATFICGPCALPAGPPPPAVCGGLDFGTGTTFSVSCSPCP